MTARKAICRLIKKYRLDSWVVFINFMQISFSSAGCHAGNNCNYSGPHQNWIIAGGADGAGGPKDERHQDFASGPALRAGQAVEWWHDCSINRNLRGPLRYKNLRDWRNRRSPSQWWIYAWRLGGSGRNGSEAGDSCVEWRQIHPWHSTNNGVSWDAGGLCVNVSSPQPRIPGVLHASERGEGAI